MEVLQKITGAGLTLRCQKGRICEFSGEAEGDCGEKNSRAENCEEEGRRTESSGEGNGFRFGGDEAGARARISFQEISGGLAGRIRVSLKNQPFTENYNLELEKPVTIDLALDENPERMTAMYMLNDWWTRPGFLSRPEEMPDRTQVIFMKFRDHYGCIAAMADKKCRTHAAAGADGRFRFVMTANVGGLRELDEIFLVMTESGTLYGAVTAAFDWIAGYKGIRKKSERRFPELFRFLGWCSWDAFYREITEDQVVEKARELRGKEVPVRWMILDDGWLSQQDEMLTDFAPDRQKFPRGFAPMIREIRGETQIRWFGVWHSLAGYWGGILPGSPVEVSESAGLCRAPNGKVLPDPAGRNAYGFYRDWYEYLCREGIDFVKVDSQSSLKSQYENMYPLTAAARNIHDALEGAASVMDGRIINCMGMAMENILSRRDSAVSRNSDDFVPGRENGFAEHLLQNAYNALYHDELYYCDWDMFWTNHEDSTRHALLRAISGGPVYFSDRVGGTDPETVKPLTYRDGEILMMSRSAKPTEDCLFADPTVSGVLKLTNTAPWGQDERAGGIAVFNLTGGRQEYCFRPSDIYDLALPDTCWVYDYFSRTAEHVKTDEACTGELPAGGFAWYLILPFHEEGTVLGLADKYNSFCAVEAVTRGNGRVCSVLHEGGEVAFLSERPLQSVLCDGEEAAERLQRRGNVSVLPVENSGKKVFVTILSEEARSEKDEK